MEPSDIKFLNRFDIQRERSRTQGVERFVDTILPNIQNEFSFLHDKEYTELCVWINERFSVVYAFWNVIDQTITNYSPDIVCRRTEFDQYSKALSELAKSVHDFVQKCPENRLRKGDKKSPWIQ